MQTPQEQNNPLGHDPEYIFTPEGRSEALMLQKFDLAIDVELEWFEDGEGKDYFSQKQLMATIAQLQMLQREHCWEAITSAVEQTIDDLLRKLQYDEHAKENAMLLFDRIEVLRKLSKTLQWIGAWGPVENS